MDFLYRWRNFNRRSTQWADVPRGGDSNALAGKKSLDGSRRCL
jgi:hypothetical protein